MYPKVEIKLGTSEYARPLYIQVSEKSTGLPSILNSTWPRVTRFKPVAVTIMSAFNSSPVFNKIPSGVKRSIVSVTTETFPLRIDLNKSPLGTKQSRSSQGLYEGVK